MPRQNSQASSPCIDICRMDEATGWCEGCLRTIDEIISWSQLSELERRHVMATLSPRRVQWRALRRERVSAAGGVDGHTEPGADKP